MSRIPGSLKGRLLMAMPGLPDPNFAQTVTCICEHNDSGALGFVINREHPLLTIQELFSDLKMSMVDGMDKMPIYLGGPVQPGAVFILHGAPFNWEGCIRVTPEIGLSNTRDILVAMGQGKGPEHAMIILGCAGWAPMQLDAEMAENSWLVGTLTMDILFKTRVDARWEQAMMHMDMEWGT